MNVCPDSWEARNPPAEDDDQRGDEAEDERVEAEDPEERTSAVKKKRNSFSLRGRRGGRETSTIQHVADWVER
jgi:hypothetical protein